MCSQSGGSQNIDVDVMHDDHANCQVHGEPVAVRPAKQSRLAVIAVS